MTVSGVSNGTNSPSSSDLTNQASMISGNFNTFLTLLTTQLKNQDPLNPLDTNQFTSQLVQFSSVEQQLQSNTYLQTLVQSSQDSSANAAVGYIGKTVTSSGVNSDLSNGSAVWSFNLPQAANVTVTVKDASGNQVFSQSGQLGAGAEQFTWDGTGTDGSTEPDGTYSISVTAKAANGTYIDASTQTTGVVSGVDLSGSQPKLIVGSQKFSLSDITSVVDAASNSGSGSSSSS